MRDNRLKIRKGLNTLYLPYYDALCDVLPIFWQPYCGTRTPHEQEDLYAIGRTISGNIRTYALPFESPHNYGCATDWFMPEWGDGKEDRWFDRWPGSLDPIWEEYSQACEKVGLKTLKFERPHNEINLGVSWKEVKKQLETFGEEAAFAFIRNNINRG